MVVPHHRLSVRRPVKDRTAFFKPIDFGQRPRFRVQFVGGDSCLALCGDVGFMHRLIVGLRCQKPLGEYCFVVFHFHFFAFRLFAKNHPPPNPRRTARTNVSSAADSCHSTEISSSPLHPQAGHSGWRTSHHSCPQIGHVAGRHPVSLSAHHPFIHLIIISSRCFSVKQTTESQ